MSNINVNIHYFEHVKTKRLVARLGNGSDVIPLKLWALAAKFYENDGLFKNLPPSELFSMAGISSDKDEKTILKALLDVGFLVKTKDGYKVHEWEQYQGHLVAYKLRGKRANELRWGRLREGKLPPLTPEEIEKEWKN